jgi:hypothetical protein
MQKGLAAKESVERRSGPRASAARPPSSSRSRRGVDALGQRPELPPETPRKKQRKTGPPLLPAQPSAKSAQALRAQTALSPASNAVLVVDAYGQNIFGEQHLGDLLAALNRSLDAFEREGTQSAEIMLVAQAHALQAMFVNLARRAARQEQIGYVEVLTRLALKAQSQCRATIETLSLVRNPPSVSFVRQANIGSAVQVNNATPAPAPQPAHALMDEPMAPPAHLLEEKHAERLDTRAPGSTGAAHPAVAPLGAVHRSED